MKIDEDIFINQKGIVEGLIKGMTINDPSIYYQNQKEFLMFYDKCAKNEWIASSIFIVNVCPISQIHSFPVFIYVSNTGSADKKFINLITYDIIEALKNEMIYVDYIGSDGDKNYRSKFKESFESISKFICHNNGIVHNIDINCPFWTNDPAHL